MRSDARLTQSTVKLVVAGIVLGLVLWLANGPLSSAVTGRHADVLRLAIQVMLGGAIYGGIVLALFGRGWLKAFRARAGR
jgi:hypothetical protein